MSDFQNYPCQEEDYLVFMEGGYSITYPHKRQFYLCRMVIKGFSAKDAAQRWAYANELDGTTRVYVMLLPRGRISSIFEVSGPEKEGEWVGGYTARLIEEMT